MMWHEARKQEKKIRGMIVDYRRRAERRKDFYEKIKADPTQFLQIHGRPCKIHLDPAVAAAGEGPAIMMQWQGDPNNMIDRFDVRAHLDYIPEVKNPEIPPEDLCTEERHCNYERFRILAQNAFLGMGEDRFLQQLSIEEQFGVTLEEKEMQRGKLNEKKGTGAAIGYNYNDPGAHPSSSNGSEAKKMEAKDSDDDSDLEILDVDLSIDVNKMEPLQAHELNAVGPNFGMAGCDLFSFLTGDADDAEHQKQLLIEEKEKAMYSGRKSRRERRAHRDKKLATRVVSPPSYAAPSSTVDKSSSRSPSRSPSPEIGGQIEFITSFGGDDDSQRVCTTSSKTLYSEKVKQNLKRTELYSEIARKSKQRSPVSEESYPCPIGPRGPNSRSRSRSRSKSRSSSRSRSRLRRSRSRSRKSRSKSWSRPRRNSRSRSDTSRSRSRSSSSRRSRSRSRNYRSKSSRSPNYSKRKKSRSISCDSSSDRGPSSKPRVPQYYGRKKEDKSSSELSVDSGSSDNDTLKNKLAVGNKPNANPNQLRSSGSSSKGLSREAQSLKEKLKKKMQAQLSRQLRADKRAEAERVERESRRQERRDEEMRELALKLRRKQREIRHRCRSSDESGRSRSGSSTRDSATGDKKRSHSKSRTPEKRPPIWESNSAPYKTDQPPLPPLPPLHTLPPPPVRRRPDSKHESKPYYDNKGDDESSSPKRISVWEKQKEPYRVKGSPPMDRKRYHDDDKYYRPDSRRYEKYSQGHDNRYDQSQNNRYESHNRYDQNQSQNSRYDQSHNQYDPGQSHNRYDQNQSHNRYDQNQSHNRYDQNQSHNRFDQSTSYPSQNSKYDYDHQSHDNRWDGNRKKSYRGNHPYKYSGYNKPPLPPGVGPSWKKDDDYNDEQRHDGKVKLVDY